MEENGEETEEILKPEKKSELTLEADSSDTVNETSRLVSPRKSLTRLARIDDSIDIESGEQEQTLECNATEHDSDDRLTIPVDLADGQKETYPDDAETGCDAKRSFPASPTSGRSSDRSSRSRSGSVADRVAYDDLSASLSIIRMDKFALEKRRVSRILPKCLHPTFVDPDVESLFQTYHKRQRRKDVSILLAIGAAFSFYSSIYSAIASYTTQEGANAPLGSSWGLPLLLTFLGLTHGLLLVLCRLHVFPEMSWVYLPYALWALFLLTLGVFMVLGPTHTASPVPRDALLWLVMLHFLVFVGLPLRLTACLVLVAITTVFYLVTSTLTAPNAPRLTVQVVSNFLLLGAATLLGLMSYFFADKKHRRAFLETRQSLEVKMVIEEQSREQERLLLSVLPKHVAETMRQDLGRGGDGQFKKIYMSRHENVSILFADIVGFTKISSTYTASELVKMLNELFARFDGLADKYKQLRIKILGDCYYCVSGAPRERKDHAVLCVHMGLSMIDAIKYVRENTGCCVDMRVGIHTGAVLAGVLGQRQWQFDVYSKDVEIANMMESSGQPGRVHISNATLHYLGDGEFEVEQAYGERREDALRAAGLKTYFISKVLKPFAPRPSLQMIRNGTKNSSPSKDVSTDNAMISRDSTMFSSVDEARILRAMAAANPDNSFKTKLQKELVNRHGRKDLLSQTSCLHLRFKNPKVEAAYRSHRETFSGAATTAVPAVVIVITAVRFLLMPNAGSGPVILVVAVVVLTCMAAVTAARSFPVRVCSGLLTASDKVHAHVSLRITWFTTLIVIAATANTIDMYLCNKPSWVLPVPKLTNGSPAADDDVNMINIGDGAINNLNLTQDDHAGTATSGSNYTLDYINVYEYGVLSDNMTDSDFNGGSVTPLWSSSSPLCPHIAYYSYFSLLILLATSLLAQICYIVKGVMILGIVIFQCIMNLHVMAKTFHQTNDWLPLTRLGHDQVSLSAELCLISILLILLNRQTEKTSRVLYLWRQEVEEQRERAADIRQRNEALVYNILPSHVATHFMGMQRKNHEELYSQSYDEIGVLFASMPNFGDFYSEESVNNQGLECLRFLNEVISDFDGLLEITKFHDIIKIKTIGSTYMAASGLNPSRQVKEDDPVKVRWAHLALLVDFAFELVRTLQSINEQSFNHFVLRMGINHGPITAGVIGARKPHYDIWGNTVNVASRMESTGKAGCIQVTEETTKILQNFGYLFEQRGLIAVKGKGDLMTYYLVGKAEQPQQVNGDIEEKTTEVRLNSQDYS